MSCSDSTQTPQICTRIVRLVSAKHGEDLVWDMSLELDDLRISTEHGDFDPPYVDPQYNSQTAILCSAFQSVLQHRWPDPCIRGQLKGLHLSALKNVCDAAWVADWLPPRDNARHLLDASTDTVTTSATGKSQQQQQEQQRSDAGFSSTGVNPNSSSRSWSSSASENSMDDAPELMPDPSDLYAVLRVARTATAAEVKASFRKLALRYHPDVNPKPDAEERFKGMVEAYGKSGCNTNLR